MTFANINTQEIRTSLPDVAVINGRTITSATLATWQALGWREVIQTDTPAAGYRVGAFGVVELTPLTCKLTVATSINIADEQAAQAAAQLAASKQGAKNLLGGSTDELQRALRAFAELTLQEINTLRTKAGLANYTWTQFLNAMNTKVDAQT